LTSCGRAVCDAPTDCFGKPPYAAHLRPLRVNGDSAAPDS
jgi:hypothetical protein